MPPDVEPISRTIARGPRKRTIFIIWAAFVTALICLVVMAFRAGPANDAVRRKQQHASQGPPQPTLRSLFPKDVRIGSAVRAEALAADSRYGRLLSQEFSALTPENSLKWANIEPVRGFYDWASSDRLMAFAASRKQAVYGHTLVWHTEVPAWVTEDLSPQEVRDLLKDHVTKVVSRYRGKIWAWDVVNEALAEDGSLRDTIWLRKLGPNYIADAFSWVRAADPNAILFINEYGAEWGNRKSAALLELVRKLRSEGVPIQGVGFQSHLPYDRSAAGMAENLARFTSSGFAVAITELDVRIDLPATPEKLQRQAALYLDVVNACLSVSGCVSLTTWGFTDAKSWIPSYHKGFGAACLFDEAYQPKPAYQALMAALLSRAAARPSATPTP
ncbi:beta-xylanase [Rhizocola hellebori]|uniref:Beta-xylanase n=1 Tax=Rhizocola hellebori TaxID=1392758 RepID=A0A8J3VE01_9ACTN|nr:endo-1,4-beta-xylanase [Rhizocola hellebori]GIH02668.1 beta-xylanase [Rhizocola hellebori]